MGEGGLKAPERYPILWDSPDFYDETQLDAEMRRVADVCHGCRRCFNLCDVFPRLFELIDNSETGELESVSSADFPHVVEACTLCDICFMAKCPYVPPHPFEIDFPHLMLRFRAVQYRQGHTPWLPRQMAHIDRTARVVQPLAPVVNWTVDVQNSVTRPILEKTTGIDRRARLPKFSGETFMRRWGKIAPPAHAEGPSFGRKAVLFATCLVNYHQPHLGQAAAGILSRHGVEVGVCYPGCCGMPLLEQGAVAEVAQKASKMAQTLVEWVDQGYDIIALVPSCALMLKNEWPLLLPENEDVQRIKAQAFDISEYILRLVREDGPVDNLRSLPEAGALHAACHVRAQGMGVPAGDLLRLIPGAGDVPIVERCSGHGGAWGIWKDHFDTAAKVGRPALKALEKSVPAGGWIATECPLAGEQIRQGLDVDRQNAVRHPLELLAEAYGVRIET